jgi:hypothetical protein
LRKASYGFWRRIKTQPATQAEAARKIASIIEEHLSECGLSEKEKNERVKGLGKRADRAIELRAKPSWLFHTWVVRLNSEFLVQSPAKPAFVVHLHQFSSLAMRARSRGPTFPLAVSGF